MVVKGGAVQSQTVNIGSVNLIVAIAAQRVKPQLVGHKENDIGAFFYHVHIHHHLIRSVTSSRSLLNARSVTSRGWGRLLSISFLMLVGLLVSTRIRWLR